MTDLSLTEAIQQFHFLRPYWLFALLGLPLLYWLFSSQQKAGNWSEVIDSHLLGALLDGQPNQQQKQRVLPALLLAWLLASLALAGPSWQKRSAPLHQADTAMVILLDLSPSMLATDMEPNRLTRSRLKLIDLLRRRVEGYTGLIAYAGSAHVVTPLTDDTATIQALLPALHPGTLPTPGSQPEDALELALELFKSSGIQQGDILLVTDGVTHDAADNMMQLLNSSQHRLSILGVGTEEGAPIPLAGGNFLRDHNDNILIPRLETGRLQSLADHNGGRFTQVRIDDKDLDFLLDPLERQLQMEAEQIERQFDLWEDSGYWLLLPILPLCLLAFRRGLIAVLLVGFIAQPKPASAAESEWGWNDLWLNNNQQGQQLLQQEKHSEAASRFEDPRWKAAAQYKAGQYQESAKTLENLNTAEDHYNRGNALTQAHQFEEAMEAYDQALKIDPDFEDAQYNKAIAEELKKQKEQQEQNQQNSDQQNSDQQNSENSDQQNQDQQSQDGEQQDSQQQNSQQESQDSQNQQSQDQQSQNGDSQDDLSEDKSHLEEADQQGEKNQNGQQQQKQAQQGSEGEQPEDNDQEQQAAQAINPESEENDSGTDPQAAAVSQLSAEEQAQQQQLEQWLRKVPDDPSGLLRRKFEYESRLRQRERRNRPPSSEQRW